MFWAKGYPVAVGEAVSNLFEEATGHSTCQTVNDSPAKLCFARSNAGNIARMLCPVSCGLKHVQSGNAFIDPNDGVPRDCRLFFAGDLEFIPCEDRPAPDPAFINMM